MPIFFFLISKITPVYFILFQLKQDSNQGIDQCTQKPKTSVDIPKEKGSSSLDIKYAY